VWLFSLLIQVLIKAEPSCKQPGSPMPADAAAG
jgi:hypothetical protein